MKHTPWIVMMPDNWRPEDCVTCGPYRHFCRERFKDDMKCPYAGAKMAVEVQPGAIISLTTKDKEPGKLDLVHKVNSKPVTLYAVEMEDEK